jgi:phage-related protein
MKAKSWDGNNINDGSNYQTVLTNSFYGIPRVEAQMARRQGYQPAVAGIERQGRLLYMDIYIRAVASRETLTKQLNQWFDPDDETPKKMLVEDYAGGNDRYVYAVCIELIEVALSAGLHYVVTLRVDGDVFWRENTAATDTWTITASGQTKTLANGGQMDAYPVIKVKPTSGKAGGYTYRRWVPIRWLVSQAYVDYPIDICADGFDTATLIGAAKMQADGDDLRVEVDGTEVDRWLDGINTATTKVWCTITFYQKQEGTITAAIASSGAVTTITINEDTSGFPSSGILMIDSEAFTFTGRNDAAKQFTGCTRAVRGTSMAAHDVGDTAWWVQHDIHILYGNSAATAPTVDSTKEPIFSLASSTNGSWVYASFRDSAGARPGIWTEATFPGVSEYYGGNQGALADPWVELGVKSNAYYARKSGLKMYNPCGITNANFTNGEKRSDNLAASWGAAILSSVDGASWTTEDSIAEPSVVSTWEAWSDNEALTAGSYFVMLYLAVGGSLTDPAYLYVEAADCTLTLNSTYTPTLTIGAEQSSYDLGCTITNTTTGKAIQLAFTMDVNSELEVDTDDKTVIYLADNSNQFQALTLVGGVRRDWLALQVGNNVLQYDETGAAGVTVTTTWEERHYQ